jgi:hypothetical protein
MHTDLNEIQSNLDSYQQFSVWMAEGNYSLKQLTECTRGELREALSYYIRQNETNSLIDTIIYSIQHYTLYTWKSQELNLVDEARLQKLLRELGYELELVDFWPTDTTKLPISKASWKETQLTKLYKLLGQYKINLNFKYRYLLLTAIGILYFSNWALLLSTLMVTYVLWAVTEIAKHDYIEHNYIVPKNQCIKYVVDFILYMTNPGMYIDKQAWIKIHVYHHSYWKSDLDQFTKNIKQGIVKTTLAVYSPLGRPTKRSLEQLLKEYPRFTWIFRYLIEIKILLVITFISTVGLEYFVYLIMAPVVLKLVLDGLHDWLLIKFGERNYGFLFPLLLNQAWHVTHHINFKQAPATWSELFNGPVWIKYINPQYYIARLLFRLRSQ